MQVAVHTANLGDFDTPVDPPEQSTDFEFHRFTDEDFPPIAGLTPRLQYRIPKTHGWQMKPGAEVYVWMDGSVGFVHKDSLRWLITQISTSDIAIFKHPNRSTIRQEVEYLERKKDHPYLKSRYANGLHLEQLAEIEESDYEDHELWASTVFVYRPTVAVQQMMKAWLYTSVRYFSCDQIALPYLAWLYNVSVSKINLDPFNNEHITLVSSHR